MSDDIPQILAALGLTAEQLIATPLRVDTGNGFIVVALDSLATLQQLVPEQQLIENLSHKYDLIGFYVFTTHTNIPGRDASTRMFAPRYGIAEESATGMAAGPLACYLHDKMATIKASYLIEQGYAMQPSSPSVITVRLAQQQGKITGLFAGGGAKRVGQRELSI